MVTAPHLAARPPNPTPGQIAQRARELKVFMLAMNTGITQLFDPSLPMLTSTLRRLGASPTDDLPIDLMHGEDEGTARERLRFSAREVLTVASSLQGDFLKDGMSVGMVTGAITIGDLIDKGGHRDATVPLLEFARHYRNACAHGNVWSFHPGQPTNPASCRSLTLTSTLNGRQATYTTVGPRLHLEYLDDIANYFVPGSAPQPRRVDPLVLLGHV